MKLESIRELTAHAASPCVSLFGRVGGPAESRKGPIRLKNLLAEAEGMLTAGGMRSPEARELLSPASELLADSLFWTRSRGGFGIFLAPGFNRRLSFPLEVEPLVVVGPRFHVKPLLPLVAGNARFLVLAISQNSVRLLECTRDRVTEVDLEDTPRSLEEALKYDDPEQQLQYHTRTAQGGPRRDAMFHGQGGAKDAAKDDLLRYFRRVDAGVAKALDGVRVPLILACVEYLLPIYREASTHLDLADTCLAGSPDRRRAEELRDGAWQILEPRIESRLESALEDYRLRASRAQASSDIREVLRAADEGRVERLFVAVDRQIWGRFEPEAGQVHIDEKPDSRNEDLLNAAAVLTLSREGEVFPLGSSEMPDGEPAAATFRY